jgi:hypothetical protein
MHHTAALLLKQMGYLIGRLDLLKICLQIEFEQSLERALAAQPCAKASLQCFPGRVEANEKVRARDQRQPAHNDASIDGPGQQRHRAQRRQEALVEDDDPIGCAGHLPGVG